VGSIALSPRGDWRMPSDASSALWLQDLEAVARDLEESSS
jgi:NAD+ synthase (glutamine-hydrolysing)